MHMTRSLLVVLLTALFAAGCGDDRTDVGGDPTPTTPPVAFDADDVVWEVRTGGGFVPEEYAVSEWPGLLVLGDGRAVRPGAQIAIYPGPLLPAVEQATLSTDELRRLAELVAGSSLFGEQPDFGFPGVTDMPTTSATTTIGSSPGTISAYALGFDDGSDMLSEAEQEARAAFQQLIADVDALVTAAASGWTIVEPPGLVVHTFAWWSADPDLQRDPVAWPLDPTVLDDLGEDGRACAVLVGDDLATFTATAATADQETPWLVGDSTRRLVVRPHWPHQPGCN